MKNQPPSLLEERAIHTNGRRGCVACIEIAIYKNTIIASGDDERIPPRMMKRALSKEFPRHSFVFSKDGWVYNRADADRFEDDGERVDLDGEQSVKFWKKLMHKRSNALKIGAFKAADSAEIAIVALEDKMSSDDLNRAGREFLKERE
jgi:hypothetical protein